MNSLFEVLSFPAFLEKVPLRSRFLRAFAAVNACAAADDQQLGGDVLPWGQGLKLAGTYRLLSVVEDSSVRAWARDAVNGLGLLGLPDYEDAGVGAVLRQWATLCCASASEQDHAVTEGGDDTLLAWEALATTAQHMDSDALEALAGHCPELLETSMRHLLLEGAPPADGLHSSCDMVTTAASCIVRVYLEAFGERTWFMVPIDVSPVDVVSGVHRHLRAVCAVRGSLDSSSIAAYVCLLAPLVDSSVNIEWRSKTLARPAFSSGDWASALEELLGGGVIVRGETPSSHLEAHKRRDPWADLWVGRLILHRAIQACVVAAESLPLSSLEWHTAVQEMCHFLGGHYDLPIQSEQHLSLVVPTAGSSGGGSCSSSGAKRRWGELSSVDSAKDASDRVMWWWPSQQSERWAALLLEALSKKPMAADPEASQCTNESAEVAFHLVIRWHTSVAVKAAEMASQYLQSVDRTLCAPLETLLGTCRPFSLPVSVHAAVFHAESLLMASIDQSLLAPHSHRFCKYLSGLAEACHSSSHDNAGGRLLDFVDCDGDASDGLSWGESGLATKGLLRSVTMMLLLAPDISGSTDVGLSLEKFIVAATGAAGSSVLSRLRALSSLADAAFVGERSAGCWLGVADALQWHRSAKGPSLQRAMVKRALDLLVLLAKRGVSLLPSTTSGAVSADEALRRIRCSSEVWQFFCSCLCNSDLMASEVCFDVLKAFRAHFRTLLELQRRTMLCSLSVWGPALVPLLDLVAQQQASSSSSSSMTSAEGLGEKDVSKVRKWSGVLLANALINAQQGGFVTSGISPVTASCRRLLVPERDPPLDSTLSSVLKTVLEDMTLAQASTSGGSMVRAHEKQFALTRYSRLLLCALQSSFSDGLRLPNCEALGKILSEGPGFG